jgi:hypothetical protein
VSSFVALCGVSGKATDYAVTAIVSPTLLAGQDIKWTDIMTAWGTVGSAVAAVVAAAVAIYIAVWLSPRQAQRAADAVEERQRRREEAAEDRRFRTAALLVLDELRGNLTSLEIAKTTNEVPASLAFETYRDHQLLLALHLKAEDRDDVRAAYVYARAPRVFVQRGNFAPEPVQQNVEAARIKTERAIAVLGWVANELPGGYRNL